MEEETIEEMALKKLAELECPSEECPADHDIDVINPTYCANCWRNHFIQVRKEKEENG